MQFVTYVAVAAFVIASAYMIVSLPLAIFRNMKSGQRFRLALSRKLAALRLPRMLRMLGIDDQAYLAQNRVVDIEKHMDNCRNCGETGRCDRDLERGELTDDGGYCPNRRHFARVEVVTVDPDRKAA